MIAIAFSLCASAQVLVDDNEDDVLTAPGTYVLKNYALSVGPKIGINYSMVSDPNDMDLGMSSNIGYSAGLAANIRFGRPAGKPFGTERFGIQLEALYSMRSLKTNIENIDMNSFEVPVLFQWYFLPTFAVEVGPTFTGVLSASPKDFKYNNVVYQLDKMKAYDVMLSVGLNCKLKNGFTADLRYNLGNSDIAGNFQTKVSTISLGIGWLFNVIK
jgi:hypothetical protein